MDQERIDKVVRDLLADYDRRDGYLSAGDVERLFDKRQLSIEEGAEVYRQLEEVGVTLEIDEIDEVITPTPEDTEDLEPDNLKTYDNFDARLKGLRTKLLTADEEVELGRRMELGRRAEAEVTNGIEPSDAHRSTLQSARRAREVMIVSNLRLVLHIARPYVPLSDLSLEDLFQEGTLGLMRAAEKYDHTLGFKFSTYATWWIRQAITRALADRGATIRLPVHMYEKVVRLKRATRLLSLAHPERRPSIRELADELTWPIDRVHFLQQMAMLAPSSLDEIVPGTDDVTYIDTIVSAEEMPEDYANRKALERSVEYVLQSLEEREQKILKLRLGLEGPADGSTLEAIGRIYAVTRERIRQIEAKALKKLRLPSRADVLRPYIDDQ